LDILRYSSDAWGQKVLEGAAWDLLSIFFAAGLVFIMVHALFKFLFDQSDQC
jgi:hypothetical protein